MPKVIKQVSWFIVVGCAAATTHWLIAVTCVEQLALHPLVANVAGWLTALTVSFAGHFRLTFRDHTRHQVGALWPAAWRFFLVSAGGFLINESAYAFLLHATTIPYDVLLFALLLGVAVLTFVLSRYWAFRRRIA